MGTAAVNIPRSTTVTVRATDLKQAVKVSTTGDFQASVNSIPAASACTANGYNLGITFKASAQGIAKGTLTLQCGTLSTVVNLTAEAVSGLPADKPSDITDCGFTATWTNIGAMADATRQLLSICN